MGSNLSSKNNMNTLIGNTLRIGVFAACIIALLGGIWYIASSAGSSLPDYTTFIKEMLVISTVEGYF